MKGDKIMLKHQNASEGGQEPPRPLVLCHASDLPTCTLAERKVMVENSKHSADGEAHTEASQATPRPRIVGIGASAGGIHALQAFFEALPEKTGAAFVVVVHLDPETRSELSSILAANTRMPVAQVGASQELHADHVYVIPPDRRLYITNRDIAAAEFDEPRGKRAPIDLFFRSLAEQHGDDFAVVLTGAGSDGANGVRAVKEAGGLILVQDPKEAEYPSMPRSAIATGIADFVLPVREIATRLVELVHTNNSVSTADGRGFDEGLLRGILAHVRLRTGHDFSQYKRSTVMRRIARRMQVTRSDELQNYYDFLRENVEEAQALLGDLLISVTRFFRDSKRSRRSVFTSCRNSWTPRSQTNQFASGYRAAPLAKRPTP